MKKTILVEVFRDPATDTYWITVAGVWLVEPGSREFHKVASFHVQAAEIRRRASEWISALL